MLVVLQRSGGHLLPVRFQAVQQTPGSFVSNVGPGGACLRRACECRSSRGPNFLQLLSPMPATRARAGIDSPCRLQHRHSAATRRPSAWTGDSERRAVVPGAAAPGCLRCQRGRSIAGDFTFFQIPSNFLSCKIFELFCSVTTCSLISQPSCLSEVELSTIFIQGLMCMIRQFR